MTPFLHLPLRAPCLFLCIPGQKGGAVGSWDVCAVAVVVGVAFGVGGVAFGVGMAVAVAAVVGCMQYTPTV